MIKRVFFLFLFCILINSSFAVDVNVEIELLDEYALYTYNFEFNEEDKYSSFSFEKPSDARISSKSDDITASSAGDFFILKTKDSRGKEYSIQFISEESIKTILDKGDFSMYVSFNIPLENVNLSIVPKGELPKVTEVFPRDYVLVEESYTWNFNNPEEELVLLRFENAPQEEGISIWIILIIILPVLFFIILLIVIKKTKQNPKEDENDEKAKVDNTEMKKEEENDEKKEDEGKEPTQEKEIEVEEKSEKEKSDESGENIQVIASSKEKKKETNPEEKYMKYVNKFLTDNEREVVGVIKENQGISQYDILSFLPKLTKSNLSKIISKLNAKKVLSRIRVGKVNKIYLGDTLEDILNPKEKEENKENDN